VRGDAEAEVVRRAVDLELEAALELDRLEEAPDAAEDGHGPEALRAERRRRDGREVVARRGVVDVAVREDLIGRAAAEPAADVGLRVAAPLDALEGALDGRPDVRELHGHRHYNQRCLPVSRPEVNWELDVAARRSSRSPARRPARG